MPATKTYLIITYAVKNRANSFASCTPKHCVRTSGVTDGVGDVASFVPRIVSKCSILFGRLRMSEFAFG